MKPELLHHNESFSRLISKLDSTEKHDSNFGNLCIKKSGWFQKEEFLFFFHRQWGVDPSPCAYATDLNQMTTFCKSTQPLRFKIARNAISSKTASKIIAYVQFTYHVKCVKLTRDVLSRVRVLGQVLRHYSDSAKYYLILGRVLKHYHFDLFLLCIQI